MATNPDIDVTFTDYDPPPASKRKLKFVRGDCRNLPLHDASFDRIIAVSLIEHIGLVEAQVKDGRPLVDNSGDKEFLKECSRLLKNEGELVLTFPFGVESGMLGSDARKYSLLDFPLFQAFFEPLVLDYYEYQHRATRAPFIQESSQKQSIKNKLNMDITCTDYTDWHGRVVWRRIPFSEARACNQKGVDGVMCSVWKKKNKIVLCLLKIIKRI